MADPTITDEMPEDDDKDKGLPTEAARSILGGLVWAAAFAFATASPASNPIRSAHEADDALGVFERVPEEDLAKVLVAMRRGANL